MQSNRIEILVLCSANMCSEIYLSINLFAYLFFLSFTNAEYWGYISPCLKGIGSQKKQGGTASEKGTWHIVKYFVTYF